jgi:hypothetical protein
MGQIEGRLEEVAKLIQSDQDAAALRLHVEEILDSPSFSTSKRSGRFLQYIVEKAISQEIDALKERTIGWRSSIARLTTTREKMPLCV